MTLFFTSSSSSLLVQKSPAVSLTKKVGKSDTLKLAYDIKSKAAAVEYAHKVRVKGEELLCPSPPPATFWDIRLLNTSINAVMLNC